MDTSCLIFIPPATFGSNLKIPPPRDWWTSKPLRRRVVRVFTGGFLQKLIFTRWFSEGDLRSRQGTKTDTRGGTGWRWTGRFCGIPLCAPSTCIGITQQIGDSKRLNCERAGETFERGLKKRSLWGPPTESNRRRGGEGRMSWFKNTSRDSLSAAGITRLDGCLTFCTVVNSPSACPRLRAQKKQKGI